MPASRTSYHLLHSSIMTDLNFPSQFKRLKARSSGALGDNIYGAWMIQFKGAYFNRATKESKSVLVQFDGVLLHIWQMTDPFCRLLTSDVFTLQPSFGKRKRYIKLPNGGKIETDDIAAFSSLTASRRSLHTGRAWFFSQLPLIWFVGVGALLALVLIFVHRAVS